MGRAARHVNGKAILYADRMTGSMERAIAETDRRRNVQLAYNLEHGTKPISIRKGVSDVMEGARADTTDFGYKMGRKKRGAEEGAPNLRMLSPEQIVREIKRMEAEMFKRARNLEFEEAARLRDAIERMKQQELGLAMPGAETGKSA
jgi:excinuclease ABC subunit B